MKYNYGIWASIFFAAFVLAFKGYEVWLGNTRCNSYSSQMANKDCKNCCHNYYTWEQKALYDVTAMIEYVVRHNTLKAIKIYYIGHSEGTTVIFVLCSTCPSFCEIYIYSAGLMVKHMFSFDFCIRSTYCILFVGTGSIHVQQHPAIGESTSWVRSRCFITSKYFIFMFTMSLCNEMVFSAKEL